MEAQMTLVPRLVSGGLDGQPHVCLARSEFADGDIVSLIALCGVWCYGSILWAVVPSIELADMALRVCSPCAYLLAEWSL